MAKKRMTAEQRRKQIIDVAAMLFSEKGFDGATTKEIAKSAKVNESIIFRHFNSKNELYTEILNKKMGGNPEDFLPKGEGTEKNDSGVFESIINSLLTANNNDPTLLRLLFYNALGNHKMSDIFFETYITRQYDFIASHIESRREQGEFRDVNPRIAARALVGMAIMYIIEKELFSSKLSEDFPAYEAVETFSEIFLRGVAKDDRSEKEQ